MSLYRDRMDELEVELADALKRGAWQAAAEIIREMTELAAKGPNA